MDSIFNVCSGTDTLRSIGEKETQNAYSKVKQEGDTFCLHGRYYRSTKYICLKGLVTLYIPELLQEDAISPSEAYSKDDVFLLISEDVSFQLHCYREKKAMIAEHGQDGIYQLFKDRFITGNKATLLEERQIQQNEINLQCVSFIHKIWTEIMFVTVWADSLIAGTFRIPYGRTAEWYGLIWILIEGLEVNDI